jgi:hypothetical protein
MNYHFENGHISKEAQMTDKVCFIDAEKILYEILKYLWRIVAY